MQWLCAHGHIINKQNCSKPLFLKNKICKKKKRSAIFENFLFCVLMLMVREKHELRTYILKLYFIYLSIQQVAMFKGKKGAVLVLADTCDL